MGLPGPEQTYKSIKILSCDSFLTHGVQVSQGHVGGRDEGL